VAHNAEARAAPCVNKQIGLAPAFEIRRLLHQLQHLAASPQLGSSVGGTVART
jgi:hypothetical protein